MQLVNLQTISYISKFFKLCLNYITMAASNQSSQLMDCYNLAIHWFEHFDKTFNREQVALSNTNILEMLENAKQYINAIIQLENEDPHSQLLYQMHTTLTNLKLRMEDQESSPKRRSRNNVKRFYKTVEDNKIKPKLSGLKDIAGYEGVKKQIKTMFVLPLKQPQLYLNRQSQKTLLLFGPPGTGKTQLVHALAAETNADIYSLTASTIMSAYIGETEKMVEIMFKVMKHVPRISILFLDEIDGLCRKRHGSEQDHNRRLKTEFMCQLSNFDENPQSFLICATNCPWDLDTAFLRRFNNRIYVPLPNRFERVELLRLFTKDTVLFNTFPFWDDLLNVTEGYSCSDLNDLVRNALLRPVNELNDIKIWKLVNDTHYIPVSKVSVEEFGENLRFCNLEELPDKSVRARDATLEDLLESTNEVKPTVPLREIERFDEYIKWH